MSYFLSTEFEDGEKILFSHDVLKTGVLPLCPNPLSSSNSTAKDFGASKPVEAVNDMSLMTT